MPAADDALYIGLMSGTSLDGTDGVLVRFGAGTAAASPPRIQVLAHEHRPFEPALKDELLALNRPGGASELHRAWLAANAVALLYADVVEALRLRHRADRAAPGWGERPPIAIGAHGQTVRHRPGEFDGIGYTCQLLNGALLAERTGLDVVMDFRSRDVAAGGQGAPLVPAFHAEVFGRPGEAWAVLNLGGIGNLTLGRPDGSVLGFDCGPGNALLDLWCQQHLGQAFDDGGRWAAGGQVIPDLLAALLAEPYLQRPPPKSTGRDLFHMEWLQQHLRAQGLAAPGQPAATGPSGPPAQDVQATLCAFTARTAADALRLHAPDVLAGLSTLRVCGGGAFNADLMRRLSEALPGVAVQPTDASGLPALQVEAAAFAWLAKAFVARQPGNLTAVTGARGQRILGALYPA